jgi:hypothetical protein
MDFKESFSMNAPSGFPQGLTPFNRFGTMKKRHNRDKGHVTHRSIVAEVPAVELQRTRWQWRRREPELTLFLREQVP